MTAPGIAIDQGGILDLDAVMAVMEASFDPSFGEAWTAPQCAGLMPMPGVWLILARDSGRAIGFALCRAVLREAELLLLAVHPRDRRRGIAETLLRQFIKDSANSGADHLHLEVREGNHAVNLYTKTGFTEVGRRKGYYVGQGGQTYDALTLAKRIGGIPA